MGGQVIEIETTEQLGQHRRVPGMQEAHTKRAIPTRDRIVDLRGPAPDASKNHRRVDIVDRFKETKQEMVPFVEFVKPRLEHFRKTLQHVSQPS